MESPDMPRAEYQELGGAEEESKDYDDVEKESSSDSSNRWNLDILNEFECKNVFMDDEDKNLPGIFDVDRVHKIKKDECFLCLE